MFAVGNSATNFGMMQFVKPILNFMLKGFDVR
jgi:hypothetical protein